MPLRGARPKIGWATGHTEVIGLRYFAQLPRPMQRVAWSTLHMAPRVKRRVRKKGYEATTQWLDQMRRPVVTSVDNATAIAGIAQITTARMPGRYNCLTRSLVVWWLLGGDRSAHIRFGVSPDPAAAFQFHAWVEKDGVVINDTDDVAARYAPFAKPPSSAMGFD